MSSFSSIVMPLLRRPLHIDEVETVHVVTTTLVLVEVLVETKPKKFLGLA